MRGEFVDQAFTVYRYDPSLGRVGMA